MTSILFDHLVRTIHISSNNYYYVLYEKCREDEYHERITVNFVLLSLHEELNSKSDI